MSRPLNAAEQVARDATRSLVMAYGSRAIMGAIAAVLVVTLAYCAGISKGKEDVRQHLVDSTRHVLADSSKAIEARIAARAAVIVPAETKVTADHVKYTATKAHVVIVSDTVLQIDSVVVNVPMPAVTLIRNADDLIRADSVLIAGLHAQLIDETKRADTWEARALLDEKNTPKVPRFGWRTGFVAGGIVVALIAKVLR